jgi:hypothetical protein
MSTFNSRMRKALLGKKTKLKKCIRCKKRNVMPYEEIGQGKFCKICFKKEMKEYYAEGGI